MSCNIWMENTVGFPSKESMKKFQRNESPAYSILMCIQFPDSEWEARARGSRGSQPPHNDGRTAAFPSSPSTLLPQEATLQGWGWGVRHRHIALLSRPWSPGIGDRFLSSCHHCFGTWMKQQLPEAVGWGEAVVRGSLCASLIWKGNSWEVRRESLSHLQLQKMHLLSPQGGEGNGTE